MVSGMLEYSILDDDELPDYNNNDEDSDLDEDSVDEASDEDIVDTIRSGGSKFAYCVCCLYSF